MYFYIYAKSPMPRKIYAILTLLLLFTQRVLGVNSYPYPVRVQQPDGTYITIKIHGDESFSYKTTLDGYIVAQGKDGFFYYADYNSGNLRISSTKVSASSRGYSKLIPARKGDVRMINASKEELLNLSSLISTKSPSSIKTLVIPVQFADVKFTTTGLYSKLYNLFNQLNYSDNGATGSVRDYFRDNIGQMCNLTFDIADMVTVPETLSYYGENVTTSSDKNVKMLVKHACSSIDRSVDFSKYDSNNDGFVDHIFIIFAGYNEAESGYDNALWPQSWNVSDMQLSYDGKKISAFSIYSEFSGASGGNFAGIGTICHEYCHLFSLLDMYDVNGSAEGQALGLGPLSIMGTGNYNNGGKTPPYLNIIERNMMGLASLTTLYANQDVVVEPVQLVTRGVKISTEKADEAFYIEYRSGNKWDKYIGGEGLVVYHVDKSYNSAGSMTAAMRWQNNAVNANQAHPCAYIVSVDGGEPIAWEDSFFPGQGDISSIHSQRTFPLKSWSGRGTGLGLVDIMKGAVGMNFRVVKDDSWDAPIITSYSIVPNQTSAQISWETDKSALGEWKVVWGLDKSVYSDTISVSKNEVLLRNLAPGEHYHCEVYYSYGNITGKVYSMPFQTTKMMSTFPLIADADKHYKTGSAIRLHLLNLAEEATSIKWFINDIEYKKDIFVFDKAGVCSLRAEITYEDGSVDILKKELIIGQ